jgi:DNA repair photolyase
LRRIEVREITCKSLLHPLEFGAGREYTANFFKGCSHGCVYCYVPSLIHEERRWGSFVDVKVNAPAVLERELRHTRKAVVFLSSATDPFQAIEARYGVTRRCLEVLLRHDFPVIILTRSPLVLRDIDILRRLTWVRVGFSVSSVSDRFYEPGVAPLQRRIETLRRLSAAGIVTWVSMAPIIPGLVTEDLEGVVWKLKDAGVRTIVPGLLRFDGYAKSKQMFEESTSIEVSSVMQRSKETMEMTREIIDRHGLEPAEETLEWHQDAGALDSYLPLTRPIEA